MVNQSKFVHLFVIILMGILTFIALFLLLNILFVDLIEARQDHIVAQSTKHLQLGTFFWMVGIVGGSIAATLTYVSWKKYKQDRKNIKNKNQSVD